MGQSAPEILTAVLRDLVVSPSVRVRKRAINPELESICLRALQKDPALRYQDAAAMCAVPTSLKIAAPTAPAPTVQAKPPARLDGRVEVLALVSLSEAGALTCLRPIQSEAPFCRPAWRLVEASGSQCADSCSCGALALVGCTGPWE